MVTAVPRLVRNQSRIRSPGVPCADAANTPRPLPSSRWQPPPGDSVCPISRENCGRTSPAPVRLCPSRRADVPRAPQPARHGEAAPGKGGAGGPGHARDGDGCPRGALCPPGLSPHPATAPRPRPPPRPAPQRGAEPHPRVPRRPAARADPHGGRDCPRPRRCRDGCLGHSPAHASGREGMMWHRRAHPAAPRGAPVPRVGATSRLRHHRRGCASTRSPTGSTPMPRCARTATVPRLCHAAGQLRHTPPAPTVAVRQRATRTDGQDPQLPAPRNRGQRHGGPSGAPLPCPPPGPAGRRPPGSPGSTRTPEPAATKNGGAATPAPLGSPVPPPPRLPPARDTAPLPPAPLT